MNHKQNIKVPLLDIPLSYKEVLADVERNINEVIKSGYFILGPVVEELEQKIAAYCGAKYAVGVSSGTDALLISLMAAGIKEDDEVITTPFTFFATAGSISRLGAKPVYVDIEPDTFNINPEQIEKNITKKTRAIIPVHLYGQCAGMDSILDLAKKNNLTVIEDAAQAIGSEYKDRKAGSLGDYGCFSFFPTKNLGGFGDGGMVTMDSEKLYEQVKILRVHGSQPKYYHKIIGGNFRLDAIQAAVVLAKLKYLDQWTDKRRENAQTYDRLFKEMGVTDSLTPPREIVPRHVYNQYVIRVKDKRDKLRNFLGENNIATEIYYPLPLHLQDCFLSLGYKKGDLPESEKAADETIALPIFPELTTDQLEYVASTITRFIKK
ncbi:MAG: DegT/DnrJ/EryC1/StrS family aminotransferase [Nitrospinaceae bacterium]|jgi:dTDP-4-amino-4,6-dideoxygalactose transaminase|nr:DegT/DnrJ/EryC1/StrS family aminotransferase [Nitrospinaceae bacterium]MDP6712595.1 DegT/DnrJ/EryC1/StrS family aminotransferase [Nitrospinaceae bacterium]MDP7058673.1 DegT/DnrJ/EryC1/StrS family aminotransferase [Nitrospinaceae bacterium]|tara:strand:+ start:277 stop:1410 length:1134 start_codon:yes stop_codon:yes gene_type:complete